MISRIILTIFISSLVLWSCVAPVFYACTVFAREIQQLPGESHKPIRRVDPKAACTFEQEYLRIKSKKSDPRVVYIDLFAIVHAGQATDFNFESLCKDISEQHGSNIAVFDRGNGFLQLFWDDEEVNDAIAFFSGSTGSPSVILYVTRLFDTWRAFVFSYQNNNWRNVTDQYLGEFHLSEKDYVIVPQYSRTARVLTFDETNNRFHHKLWLTWDGAKFLASTAKKNPGWRCPDSYQYFAPTERGQYCR